MPPPPRSYPCLRAPAAYRPRPWHAPLIVLAALVCAACSADGNRGPLASAEGDPADWSTLASFRQARSVVARGLNAMGGLEAIARAGGLALEGEGVVDLGTLLQGNRPFEGDPYPISERLALLPQDARLVHEFSGPINPDAASWQRVDHRPDGTYRINLATGRASWGRPGNRLSIERTIPHHLLAEVLTNPSSLRHVGSVRTAHGVRTAVSWTAPDRGPLTLLFDPVSGLLRAVESVADLPVRGDARIVWRFRDYSDVPGLGPYPTGYSIHIDDERLQEVRWTARESAPAGGVLEPPEGVALPDPTPFEEPSSGTVAGGGDGDVDRSEQPFDIRTLAPGVHLLVNLRTGFHVLFVEFEQYVVAVDAPSGWWEVQELPPRNWAGSDSPALGERYVEGIRSMVGDKPIGYVLLTHHHSDHAGGVRAFVDAGATVIGSEPTRAVVARTLDGSLELAGRSDARPLPFEFTRVDGQTTLRDATMELRVMDVGANPHAEGMLAVWLPEPEILYVSDLFDPWGSQGSPSAQRLPVMTWFVDWLDASGLDPERIYAIHGAALVTEDHLDAIRRVRDEGG